MLLYIGLYDQSLYAGGGAQPHSLPEFHSRMQSFGFGGGPGVPASLDQAQAAAAAQYMAAGAAGYDMYKGRFQAVQGMLFNSGKPF